MYFPGEYGQSSSDSDSSESSEEEKEEEFVAAPSGDIYSFGYGYFGQLGHSSCDSIPFPKKIDGLANISFVSCGEAHSIAISAGGVVYAWGNNRYGQLGVGDIVDRLRPVMVEAMKSVRVKKAACGAHHTALITSKSEIFTFGCGRMDRLGIGDTRNQLSPRLVSALRGKDIADVACGGSFTACLTKTGTLYTWGNNKYGQLGHSKTGIQSLPRLVSALHAKRLTQIAAGKHHLLVSTDRGELFSFGLGICGQLGHRSKSNQPIPKYVESLAKKECSLLAAGYLHSVCITSDNKLYSWGYLSEDHLGLTEGEEYHSAPVPIPLPILNGKIVKISASGYHSSCVTDQGEICIWGFGYMGRLGYLDDMNSDSVNPTTPVLMNFFQGMKAVDVACGGAHTLVVVQGSKDEAAPPQEVFMETRTGLD